jgi:hypothetical protein
LIRANNRVLIAGDGIKVAKEAEKMPAVNKLRGLQSKPVSILKGNEKISVATLMTSMAVDQVKGLDTRCLIVLDAYFAA